MKTKLLFGLLMSSVFSFGQVLSELPIYENFNYTSGTTLLDSGTSTGQGPWTEDNYGSTKNPSVITSPFSTYSGLPAFSGNAIEIKGGTNDPLLYFEPVNENDGVNLYASCMIKVTDMSAISGSLDYFFALSTSGFGYGAALYFSKIDATTYNLGINESNTSGEAVVYTGATFTENVDEIFVVIKYEFNSAGNSIARLFVNPTISGAIEPASNQDTSSIALVDEANRSEFTLLKINANSNSRTPGIAIDEIRIGTSWEDVTSTTTLTTEKDWTGATDTDWATATNWSPNAIPRTVDNLEIPNVTNKPIISSITGAVANNLSVDASSSLTIEGGGSLIVSGTSTGDIIYNVSVTDTNWHLVASPLVGATYNDTWIVNNDIASGSDFGTNRGISTYDNSGFTTPNVSGAGGHWRYTQGGDSGTFGTGIGYALIKDANPGVSSGNYSFTGTMPITSTPAISQGVNNWNLIGNSFPSYMDITKFIASNGTSGSDKLSDAFQAVYIFNASTGLYEDLTSGFLQPGQAFFVNSKVSSSTASITKDMQSHQTGVTFYKSSTTALNLSVSNGKSTKTTEIKYLDDKTKGLDPGFDIGMFNGVAQELSVYTNLVENNEGIAFKRQALPLSAMESTIIPIGLKAEAGKEITFTTDALNLPSGINVYLEDRMSNTYTRLNEVNVEYKITLTEDLNGIGRFYLHTSAKSVLSVDENLELENVSIYKTSNSTLRIVGLPQGKTNIKFFNILGKQMMRKSIDFNGFKDISIPKLSAGIYIVQLETATGKLSKKIILE